MTKDATPDRAAIERDLMLDTLRNSNMERTERFGHHRLGLSSTQLVISTVTGEPPTKHPWDEGDVEGLYKTLTMFPPELIDAARDVFEQQLDLYKAARATRS